VLGKRGDALVVWYAALTGAMLAAWWLATLAGFLPSALMPVQRQPSHLIAELLLAAGLMTASWLGVKANRLARLALASALGGLLYATVNVLGDYDWTVPMTVLLATSAALTVVSLGILLRND
jgi:hypothetical protein